MKYLPGLLLVFFCNTLVAQIPEADSSKLYTQAMRLNMLGVFDLFDGNLSVGGEYAFSPRFSLTTDLSFVFYSLYFQNNKRALGYIVKPSIRYYIDENRRGFIEAAFFYKRVGYKMEDWLDKEPVNGLPTFQQFQEFILRKRVLGLNFQTGLQRNISKNKQLKIEGYVGLGVRFKWQDIKNNPDAVFNRNNFWLSSENRDFYTMPSFPLGVRLAYVIK